jgi:hypothetical protein
LQNFVAAFAKRNKREKFQFLIEKHKNPEKKRVKCFMDGVEAQLWLVEQNVND